MFLAGAIFTFYCLGLGGLGYELAGWTHGTPGGCLLSVVIAFVCLLRSARTELPLWGLIKLSESGSKTMENNEGLCRSTLKE